MVIDSLDKDLDVRDKWLGLRNLRSNYNPHPYSRTTKHGEHVHTKQRAQKAAEDLGTTQWGESEERRTF